MGNNLSRVFSTDLTTTSNQGQVEQYNSDSNTQAVYKKTMEHVAQERAQAVKTGVAIDLTKQLHLHAQQSVVDFADRREQMTAPNGRSADTQAYIDDASAKLGSLYVNHVGAVLNDGVAQVNKYAKDDIIPEKKKGWFR